jgi:hypothetical protein
VRYVDVLALSDCSLVKLSRLAGQSGKGIAKRQDYSCGKSNGLRHYGVHGVLGRSIESDILAVVPGDKFAEIKVWSQSEQYTQLPEVGLAAQFCDGPTLSTKLPANAGAYVDFLERLHAVEAQLESADLPGARKSLHKLEKDFPIEKYAAREVVSSILMHIGNDTGKSGHSRVSIEKAKRELVHRGNSICDVFALEHAAEQNMGQVSERLKSVELPNEFDVVYKPGKYVNGADVTILEAHRGLIDQFLLLGHLKPSEIRDLSPSGLLALEKLEADGMAARDGKRNAFLTMKGLDAWKKQSSTDRVARVMESRANLRPLDEFPGVVDAPPANGRQAVRITRNAGEEVRLFSASRLEKIGCSAVGSRVIYRYYETDEGALSVLDPDVFATAKKLKNAKGPFSAPEVASMARR